MYHRSLFGRFAKQIARLTGHPAAFAVALLSIMAWAVTGPTFGYSDTWQLVINTSTTIVTFLMVFLIQNTQNRDSAAVQLKLDELIRASHGAHNALLDLEELSEAELDHLREVYEELARQARAQLQRGVLDTDTPEVQGAQLQAVARAMPGAPRAGSLVLFDQAGNPIWSAALASQQGEAHP
jgi:low affinity Fe/Cu permease